MLAEGGLSRRLRSRHGLAPNDRYVNDEKICQAVVAMLPKSASSEPARPDNAPCTSPRSCATRRRQAWARPVFFMLGLVAGHDLRRAQCLRIRMIQAPQRVAPRRDCSQPAGNSNKRVDELSDAMEQGDRQGTSADAMIREATKIYSPTSMPTFRCTQQALAVGGCEKNIDLVQPADNSFPASAS